MENETRELKSIQFIRELCNEKTEEEILEAEQNFREFLLVIKEIADRMEVECRIFEDFELENEKC